MTTPMGFVSFRIPEKLIKDGVTNTKIDDNMYINNMQHFSYHSTGKNFLFGIRPPDDSPTIYYDYYWKMRAHAVKKHSDEQAAY
jgi:hypothetical protein